MEQLTMDDILIYFYEIFNGEWDEIFKAINRKQRVDKDICIPMVRKLMEEYDYITVIDDDYPEEYKTQYKPPFVIKTKKIKV